MLYNTIHYVLLIIVGGFFIVWVLMCFTVLAWVSWGIFDRFVVAPLLKLFRRNPEQSSGNDRKKELEHIVKTLRKEKPGTRMKYHDRKTKRIYIIGDNGRKVCFRYSLKNKFKHTPKPIDRDFFKKG